ASLHALAYCTSFEPIQQLKLTLTLPALNRLHPGDVSVIGLWRDRLLPTLGHKWSELVGDRDVIMYLRNEVQKWEDECERTGERALLRNHVRAVFGASPLASVAAAFAFVVAMFLAVVLTILTRDLVQNIPLPVKGG